MKIEIEFEEVESLKKEIECLKVQNKELESRLINVDEKNIERRAASLATEMFCASMVAVFEKLGFDKPMFPLDQIIFKDGPPVRFPLSEDNKISIGAELYEGFKHAFIMIGVDTDKFKRK